MECFFGKRFLNNGSVSTKPSLQEQNKSSKCHFFTVHYSKNASHQQPEHYDQPKLPYLKVLSTAIPTYLNPRSL